MARSPRMEYPGAGYHVLCRGDQREPIFQHDADRELFLKTMGEVCQKTGWRGPAYGLMPNHYHGLIETPEGNLVRGMRWFQSPYTRRYNGRHQQCGHVFQGRYKALLLDGAAPEYFRMVSDDIHLNPARARLLDPERPDTRPFRGSRFPVYAGPAKRSDWLETARVLVFFTKGQVISSMPRSGGEHLPFGALHATGAIAKLAERHGCPQSLRCKACQYVGLTTATSSGFPMAMSRTSEVDPPFRQHFRRKPCRQASGCGSPCLAFPVENHSGRL